MTTRKHDPADGVPVPVDYLTARTLLLKTARNSARPGTIGSPRTPHGYDVATALSLLASASRVQASTHLGIPTVEALLAGYGWHTWYIRTEPLVEDPWAVR
jgi:hypothetical protein